MPEGTGAGASHGGQPELSPHCLWLLLGTWPALTCLVSPGSKCGWPKMAPHSLSGSYTPHPIQGLKQHPKQELLQLLLSFLLQGGGAGHTAAPASRSLTHSGSGQRRPQGSLRPGDRRPVRHPGTRTLLRQEQALTSCEATRRGHHPAGWNPEFPSQTRWLYLSWTPVAPGWPQQALRVAHKAHPGLASLLGRHGAADRCDDLSCRPELQEPAPLGERNVARVAVGAPALLPDP